MRRSHLVVAVGLTVLLGTALHAEELKTAATAGISLERDTFLRASDLGMHCFVIKAPSGNDHALSIITVVYDPLEGNGPLRTHECILYSQEKTGYSERIVVCDTRYWEGGSPRYVIKGPGINSRPVESEGSSSIYSVPMHASLQRLVDKGTPVDLTAPDQAPEENKRLEEHFAKRYTHIMGLWTSNDNGVQYKYAVFARLRPIKDYNGTGIEEAFKHNATGFRYSNPEVRLPPEIAEHFKEQIAKIKQD